MFRNLMDFSYQRTALQALGWYLSFLLFGGMLAEVVAVFFTRPATSSGLQNVLPVFRWVGIVYSILLATALLRFRWKSVLNVFLAILAVLLGLLVGPLGALIPLAVMTTRHREKSPKEVGGVFE